MDQETDQEMVKTTIVISKDLWRKSRIRAAHDDEDFRTVVIRALVEYLASPPRPKTRVRVIKGPEARKFMEEGQWMTDEAKPKKGGKK